MSSARHVLIASHHLQEFAGSEIVTLELAAEFRRNGWTVDIAGFLVGDPMLSAFNSRGFKVRSLIDDIDLIADREYSLVWIHHAPVYYQLCLAHRIRAKKIIHSCLSPFEPLEVVPSAAKQINFILANSQETKYAVETILGPDDPRIRLFPNSVPFEFWQYSKDAYPTVPRKIGIVSNHLPSELIQAAKQLIEKKIDIVHIGKDGSRELVTPELLMGLDAVITIGKTVQYCFALKIPVYCYDHFGGCGWITEENFDHSARHNFSGRGFSTKSADSLVREIVEDYLQAQKSLPFLRFKAEQIYDLRRNLQDLLSKPLAYPVSLPNEEQNIVLILRQHACYLRILKQLRSMVEIGNSYRTVDAYLNETRRMWTWKLSAPLRYVERWARRRWVIRKQRKTC